MWKTPGLCAALLAGCLGLATAGFAQSQPGPEDPATWRAAVLAAVQQSPGDPAALLARGEYYFWLGNASFAEADARSALKANWKDARAWDLLSRALEKQGLLADSLAALEKAAENSPPGPGGLIKLAGLRLRCGDLGAAEASFARALGAAPSAALLAEAAAAYALAGEELAARRSIERALAQNPTDADLGALKKAAESAGLSDLIQQCLDRMASAPPGQDPATLAKARPSDPLAQLALAKQALALGDPQLALSSAATALQLAPELAEAHDLRAQAQAQLRESAAGIAEWRQALALDPSAERYLSLVDSLDTSGDANGSSQALRELLQAFPNHPLARRANADRLYADGQYEAAAQEYERSARSSPRDPELLNMSANCYYKQAQYKEAAGLYQRSLGLRFDPAVAANLARTKGKLEGDSAALAAFGQYIADHPAEPALLVARGDLRYSLGQFEDARRDFREAVRLNPADAASANGAGLCELALGETEAALGSFESAAQLEPQPEYFENAAHTAGLLERWADVERLARAGLASAAESPQLLAKLGEALDKQGRKAEALEVLGQSAAAGSDPGLYVAAAQAARSQQSAEAERRIWQAGLSRFPRDFGLNAAYVEALRQGSDQQALLTQVRSARAALGKDYPRLLDALASAWLAEQDAPGAEQFFAALIAADPRDADAYAQLALVQAAQQHFDAGLDTIKRGLNDAGSTYLGRYLECYLTAMTLGGDSALPLARELVKSPEAEPNGWLLLLRLLEEQGIYGEQVDTGRQALAAFPREGRILQYFARGLYFTGDSAGAVEALTAESAVGLDCPLRDQILGAAYLELGNWTRAASHLTAASNADPRRAELKAQLGQALLELGQIPEALEALDSAIELDPNLPSAHVWRGMLDLARSNPEAAGAQFELVKKSPLSGRDELAWATLGQGRAAQMQGDNETARVKLSEAQAFGYNTDAFYSACDELEAMLGR